MKASLPRQRIIQLFDELDGKLTVISFDKDGHRAFTYGGLNPFLALAEVAHRQAIGQQTLILILDGHQGRLGNHISDIPTELVWNPTWREMDKFKN